MCFIGDLQCDHNKFSRRYVLVVGSDGHGDRFSEITIPNLKVQLMSENKSPQAPDGKSMNWDTGTHDAFYSYYRDQSASPQTRERFERIHRLLARLIDAGGTDKALNVADIGCGAGAQSFIWANHGHQVFGLDVSEQLIGLARARTKDLRTLPAFMVGSATTLPWTDGSMDLVLLPELLEHVPDWKSVVDEAIRVLKPGGMLYLSTTNKLCPKQQEFELFGYSWYPGFLKRHYERLARTSRPELANYAKYPAVNWFTYFGLRKYLAPRGFDCMDRFDAMDMSGKGAVSRAIHAVIRSVALIRYLAHFVVPSTVVVARKRKLHSR